MATARLSASNGKQIKLIESNSTFYKNKKKTFFKYLKYKRKQKIDMRNK